ncbi:conserved hypothetical protein [uncultured Eubacteriales bacterium]|uniref:DUF7666 domain-containing protein n=1 Tax=uncultured Eubacteriales bacterium TaxID=172733 RepID=A0A212IVI4_9FIRM|nr:conserved hypothetical protein [uncultured Eubacteriales bacterium]
MSLIAYKMFDPGLICRGYQFKADAMNVTEKANCRSNGFHCAENPLDCLTYYPNFSEAECWEVEAGGDIDEDDIDSKISCTEMRLIRRLSLRDFLEAALLYIVRHPFREWNGNVIRDCGAAENGFAIVRGVDPAAAGPQGAYLALAKENPLTRRIEEIALWEVDGSGRKPGVYYDCQGKEREEAD